MGHAARQPAMTAAEFLAWEAGQVERHEFVSGEVFAMAGAGAGHAMVAGNLYMALRQHLRGTPCRTFMSDMKLHAETSGSYFYPDVFVTCSASDRTSQLVMREPTLVIEVLSPGTAAYDRGAKFAHYRQFPDLRSLSGALKAACPKGIDGYFENVGGVILDAVMLRANAFSRVAMCGMIAGYNGEPMPMANPALILVNRMKIQGFIVSEHMNVWPEALKELGAGVATGQIKFRESVAQGIASAPEAFLGLLKGKNFGKQLVKLV